MYKFLDLFNNVVTVKLITTAVIVSVTFKRTNKIWKAGFYVKNSFAETLQNLYTALPPCISMIYEELVEKIISKLLGWEDAYYIGHNPKNPYKDLEGLDLEKFQYFTYGYFDKSIPQYCVEWGKEALDKLKDATYQMAVVNLEINSRDDRAAINKFYDGSVKVGHIKRTKLNLFQEVLLHFLDKTHDINDDLVYDKALVDVLLQDLTNMNKKQKIRICYFPTVGHSQVSHISDKVFGNVVCRTLPLNDFYIIQDAVDYKYSDDFIIKETSEYYKERSKYYYKDLATIPESEVKAFEAFQEKFGGIYPEAAYKPFDEDLYFDGPMDSYKSQAFIEVPDYAGNDEASYHIEPLKGRAWHERTHHYDGCLTKVIYSDLINQVNELWPNKAGEYKNVELIEELAKASNTPVGICPLCGKEYNLAAHGHCPQCGLTNVVYSDFRKGLSDVPTEFKFISDQGFPTLLVKEGSEWAEYYLPEMFDADDQEIMKMYLLDTDENIELAFSQNYYYSGHFSQEEAPLYESNLDYEPDYDDYEVLQDSYEAAGYDLYESDDDEDDGE